MTALETLQRYLLSYLLGVSDSVEAQISLLSVEQFVISKGRCTTQMTMDYLGTRLLLCYTVCFYKCLFVAFMVTTYLGYNVLFFPVPRSTL